MEYIIEYSVSVYFTNGYSMGYSSRFPMESKNTPTDEEIKALVMEDLKKNLKRAIGWTFDELMEEPEFDRIDFYDVEVTRYVLTDSWGPIKKQTK